MKYKAKCTKCDKVFNWAGDGKPYKSQSAADAALRMHVARTHDKTIDNTGSHKKAKRLARVHSRALALAGTHRGNVVDDFDERKPRKRLSPEQLSGVLDFINTRRGQFTTKSGCFVAALEASGAAHIIQSNSTAVDRYFKLAKQARRQVNGRSRLQEIIIQPVAKKTINFCPNCGDNIKGHALAAIIAQRLQDGAVVLIDGERMEHAS